MELQTRPVINIGEMRNVKGAYRIAVVEWIPEEDGLADVICDELNALGYSACIVHHDSAISEDIDIVLTFGPYGDYLHTIQHISSKPYDISPIFAHWNTEGMPDPRLPWSVVNAGGAWRSWIGRFGQRHNGFIGSLARKVTAPWENRILRFRYVGDYHYAFQNDLLHVFSDSSAIYADWHRQHGLPTVVAPWGSTRRWYADLDLERDIDVLWIGQRGSKRRSRLLDSVRQELRQKGVDVHVIDNEENPFVYGKERTRIFNRAKITLNLTRTWFDDNFSRFAMALPNRSLIVSEPMLPHCPQYEEGVHFISAPIQELPEVILYYLNNEAERLHIVENAYRLSTKKLTLRNSIAAIMDAVVEKHQAIVA